MQVKRLKSNFKGKFSEQPLTLSDAKRVVRVMREMLEAKGVSLRSVRSAIRRSIRPAKLRETLFDILTYRLDRDEVQRLVDMGVHLLVTDWPACLAYEEKGIIVPATVNYRCTLRRSGRGRTVYYIPLCRAGLLLGSPTWVNWGGRPTWQDRGPVVPGFTRW